MRRALLTLAVLVVVAVGVAPRAAEAQTADGPLRGQVEGGLGGFMVPGRPTPVRVTLSSDDLRSGELVVAVAGGPSETADFEIAGGSSEEHWALLDPSGTMAGGAPRITATARSGGREVELGEVQLEYDADAHLLGTLAGLGGIDRPSADTRVGDQTVEFIPLSDGLLDLGPGALAALDSVAVTPEDIGALSDQHREALLGWLDLGGTLYVDAPPGPLPDWPDALQPTAPVVRSGLARVVSTDGALAEGRWSDVVLPAPNRSIDEDGIAGQGVPTLSPQFELFGVDLGRDLPSLSGLLAVLAIYTVLVGPVAYVMFRRRVMGRWIAIPVLALLATGVLFVRGDGIGADTTASVVDVIETGPGAAMATTRVLMSTDVGDQRITAPAGWTGRNDPLLGQASPVTQRRSADHVEISVPAQAGGVGLVSAQGPVTFAGTLAIDASASDDGTITGTVTNTTDVTLDEVAVFVGRINGLALGVLAPGESTDFEIVGTNQMSFGSDGFVSAWPGEANGAFGSVSMVGGASGTIMMGGPAMSCDSSGNCFSTGFGGGGPCTGVGCDTGAARPAALSSALRARGTNAMPVGIVTAVGWARDLPPVVELGSGVDVVETRTAVVNRQVPTVPGDRLVDSGSSRSMLAVEQTGGQLELMFSWDLPAAVGGRPVDPSRLRMRMPFNYTWVEVLTPDGPRVLREEGDQPEGEEVVVPPEAVVDGRVLYRVRLRPVPPNPGPDMAVYEAQP